MPKGIWGLDVSKSSIKGVRIEASKEGIELTDLEIVPYTPAPTRDEASLEQEIRLALGTFIAKHKKVRNDIVVASLPGHSTFNRFVKIPAINKERLNEIIRYEAQQHIPFAIEEVIWAYQLIERDYQPGEELDVVFFAIKRDLVDQFLSLMSISGVRVDIIQFAAVAMYNFVMTDVLPDVHRSKSGVVILDMGANNTDLILMDGNKFWIRPLPIVGNDITKSIQEKMEIPFAEADKIKTSTTSTETPEAGKIFGAIQPILKDLASEIHRSLGFYKSISTGRTIQFDKIILAGNATKVLYFEEFLSQRLQAEVIKLGRLNKIEVADKVDNKLLVDNLPSLGVAIGLALQGAGVTPNKINMMPPELLKIKETGRKKPFVFAVAASLLALVLLLHLSAKATYQQLEECNTGAKQTLDDAAKKVKDYNKIKATKDKENYLAAIASLGAERDIWIRIFNAFNKIPALTPTTLAPARGYIETINGTVNSDDENVVRQAEQGRIWLLSLKSERLDKDNIVNIDIICGMVARRKADGEPDPVGSQEFVKEQLVKPLAAEFGIQERAPSTLDNKPVAELKTDEEIKEAPSEPGAGTAESTPKYYRFKINFQIPVSGVVEFVPPVEPKPATNEPAKKKGKQ